MTLLFLLLVFLLAVCHVAALRRTVLPQGVAMRQDDQLVNACNDTAYLSNFNIAVNSRTFGDGGFETYSRRLTYERYCETDNNVLLWRAR